MRQRRLGYRELFQDDTVSEWQSCRHGPGHSRWGDSWWVLRFQHGCPLGSHPPPLGYEVAEVPGQPYHLPSPGTAALRADVWAWMWTPSMEQRSLPPRAPQLQGEGPCPDPPALAGSGQEASWPPSAPLHLQPRSPVDMTSRTSS